MPFSSSPVYVGKNDSIQIRYPTPSTWNTNVTVQVQIGTGNDPDGITFGTKIPDGLIDNINFDDQDGFTGAFNGTSSSGAVNVFQPNTYYYSNVVNISGIEIPVPATVSCVANGPKNSNTNNTTAQFRIYRNGAFGGWTSSVTADIAAGTGGLQPGDKVQLRVKTENWYVTAHTLTFTVGDETFGTNIGEPSDVRVETWSISTRPQDQQNAQFSFTDKVDEKITGDGGSAYLYHKVKIEGIDSDVVLKAVAKNRSGFSSNQINIAKTIGDATSSSIANGEWTNSIDNELVTGDYVHIRIARPSTYTTQHNGEVEIKSESGAFYTRGGVAYENVTTGTYGSGEYQVTQSTGLVEDQWHVFTEVDRYPNPITIDEVYTYGVRTFVTANGSGYLADTIYETTTSGSGSGMQIELGPGGPGSGIITNFDGTNNVIVRDPGYGYAVGDTVTIVNPTPDTAQAVIELLEYEKVSIDKRSATSLSVVVEPGMTYFCDVTVTGLGTEYANGAYDTLSTPFSDRTSGSLSKTNITNNTLGGAAVGIGGQVLGSFGKVRKNNTGAWTNDVNCLEGDQVNLKLLSNTNFGDSLNLNFRLNGPPDGNSNQGFENPTNGPTTPTYPDIELSLTLVTRNARDLPYPFHANPQYLVTPLQECIAVVPIEGLDRNASAILTGNDPVLAETNAGLSTSLDGPFSSNITITPTTKFIYVLQNAPSTGGATCTVNYKIQSQVNSDAFMTDQFTVWTKRSDLTTGDYPSEEIQGTAGMIEKGLSSYADSFTLILVGAGGGRGGDDAPNSFGAGGAAGNVVKVDVSIDPDAWPKQVDFPDVPDRRLFCYSATAGGDGATMGTGASSSGAGGFGYAYGGDGGNAGTGDKSGGGGGGGGATAITLVDGTLIAMAGGGGGGAGAGNDTTPPEDNQYGSWKSSNPYGSAYTTQDNISLNGDTNDGADATGEGGGAGGGGGGYIYHTGNTFSRGSLVSNKTDVGGNIIQTDDLDATGGQGGGIYYASGVSGINVSTPQMWAGRGAPPGKNGAIYIEYAPQDNTPVLTPGAFTPIDGQPTETYVESEEKLLITDITGSVNVNIDGFGQAADVRVCGTENDNSCGAWNAGATITNNSYLQVRLRTGTQNLQTYPATIDIGTVSTNWSVSTGEAPDFLPNDYFWEWEYEKTPNDIVQSEKIKLTGFNQSLQISGTAEYGIIEAQITRTVGDQVTVYPYVNIASSNNVQVLSNDEVRLRTTTAPGFLGVAGQDSTSAAFITIGDGDTVEWRLTNAAEGDLLPDPFGFLPRSGIPVNTETFSVPTPVELENFDSTLDIIITTGPDDEPENSVTALLPELVINSDRYVPTAAEHSAGTYTRTVDPGDKITLYYTTTDVIGEYREFLVMVGLPTAQSSQGYREGIWSVATSGVFGQYPVPFEFATKTAQPSVLVESDEVHTLSGINVPVQLETTNGLEVKITRGATSITQGLVNTPYQTFEDTGITVNAGDQIQVRLLSSAINGFPRSGKISVGTYDTTFVVFTVGVTQDPILGQWYSSISKVSYIGHDDNVDSVLDPSTQFRSMTKFDGAPVGSMLPVFQQVGEDKWGNLDGTMNSRFPGYMYCDGSYVDPEEFPLLFKAIGITYGQEVVSGGGVPWTVNLYNAGGQLVHEKGDLGKYLIRLPDFRNRYVKGTGVIDGTSAASPGLNPDVLPTGLSGSPGNLVPGASGGMWFIDTIADPGVDELEQVYTPAEGLKAIESDFFGIANLVTTGYTNVSGLVEFRTVGSCKTTVELDDTPIYDVPLHFHNMPVGQPDAGGVKSTIRWGRDGGYQKPWNSLSSGSGTGSGGFGSDDGRSVTQAFSGTMNAWGYFFSDVPLTKDNLPDSANCGEAKWWNTNQYDGGLKEWCDPEDGGCSTNFQGIENVGEYPTVVLKQPAMQTSTAAYKEIQCYIDPDFLNIGNGEQSESGISGRQQFAAITIPSKFITISPFTPDEKLSHTHYLSKLEPDDPAIFSYGNVDGAGTPTAAYDSSTAVNKTTSVELEFSAEELGILVLPGTFTLTAGKQLTPIPEFSPQTKVALMSPYVWTKWIMKVY